MVARRKVRQLKLFGRGWGIGINQWKSREFRLLDSRSVHREGLWLRREGIWEGQLYNLMGEISGSVRFREVCIEREDPAREAIAE